MNEERHHIYALVVENRQMIATILADLLSEAGFGTQVCQDLAAAQETLPHHLPAVLLVDLGMVRAQTEETWQALQQIATALEVPIMPFSCSPLPDREDVMILRSPADFANMVDSLEHELEKRKPLVGMALVRAGLLTFDEVNAVLQVQRLLASVGRHQTLGDLIVQLGFVEREVLEEALQEEEA